MDLSGELHKKGNYLEFSGDANPAQMMAFAEILKFQGNNRAYSKLMDLAKKNKPVYGVFKTDGSQIVDLSANNEAIVQEKDVASTKKLSEYLDKDKVDKGPEFTPAAVREDITDKSADNPISEIYADLVGKYGESAMIAYDTAALKYFKSVGYEHTGSITGTTTIGGSIQANEDTDNAILGWIMKKISGFGFSSRIGADISNKNAEKEATNLLYFTLRKIDEESREAAMINGQFNKEVFKKIHHKKMYQLGNEIQDIIEGRDPTRYGKDSILGNALALWPKHRAEFLKKGIQKAVEDSGLVKEGFYDLSPSQRFNTGKK